MVHGHHPDEARSMSMRDLELLAITAMTLETRQ